MIQEKYTYSIGNKKIISDHLDRQRLEIFCVILDTLYHKNRTFHYKKKLISNRLTRYLLKFLRPIQHIKLEYKVKICLVVSLISLISWMILFLALWLQKMYLLMLLFSGFLLLFNYIPFQFCLVLYNRCRFYKLSFNKDSAHFMNRKMFEYERIMSFWTRASLLRCALSSTEKLYYPSEEELYYINEIVKNLEYISWSFYSNTTIRRARYFIKNNGSFYCL